MSGIGVQLGLVAFLTAVNAVFAGTEMALVTLREGQLRRLAEESKTGELLAQIVREPNNFLSTIQVLITLAGFLSSATAAVTLAGPLAPVFSFLGSAARPTAVVVVTVTLAYLTLVLGELAPKRLAMQRAERWAMVMARPLSALTRFARPVVWLLSRSTDLVVRLAGGDPAKRGEDVTEEELHVLVANQAAFTPSHRRIIHDALELADRTLSEVIVPRRDVFTISAEMPSDDALERLVSSSHSRAPVVGPAGLDDVVGVVHLRDLYRGDQMPVGQAATAPVLFPETTHVVPALREMQKRRAQMAVVINEHGAAEGIVTVEDLLEELVGEIYDETDRDRDAVTTEADGSLVVPGGFPFHDLPDVGVDLPEGDYTTVAGFVLDRLGRVPEAPGVAVTELGWTVRVLAMDGHLITRVRLTSDRGLSPEADGSATPPPADGRRRR